MFFTVMCLIIGVVGIPLIADTVEKQEGNTVKTPIVISSLPDNVKLIIGEKEEYYAPRVRAVHALSNNLPNDQIEAFYSFLAKKIETQKLPDLEFNGLKNELTFILIRQQKKPADLAAHLVKMYHDKSYDTTWRDYCVQFFGKWYPFAPDNQGRKDMVAGLWDALKNERRSKIAGAGASQLAFLAKQHPQEFDKDKIVVACLEALNDPDCADISKVACLQACAQLGDNRVLPIARILASTTSDPILRASAVGAIGLVGDKSDLEFLRKLETSKDMRIQKPAKSAIERIMKRTS